jgi:hypothetical protein
MTGGSRTVFFLATAILLTGGVAACGSSAGSAGPSHPPKPILVAGKCPDEEPMAPEGGDRSAGAKGQTVRGGAQVTEIVVCRYETFGGGRSERSFLSERKLGRDEGARVAALVSRLNEQDPGFEGDLECPSGNPLSFWIVIRFANGTETQLEDELHSCDTISDIGLGTYWESGGALDAELETLVAGRSRRL